jgi:hypothetical protein
MDSVVTFSERVAHAAYAHLAPGRQTTKGWHTARDQLITPSSFGTTLWSLGGGGGPL